MIGICGLCQNQAELQRSHLLPAAVFKAVAQGQAPYDGAPVVMDIVKGTAVQSNDQARKPFLCSDCEQRFSSQGEAKVLAMCHRKDGMFRLRDILKAATSSHTDSGRAIYYGDRLPPEIDGEAFQYFVLSVLWRASATTWLSATGTAYGALGPYEELFRRYLLGGASIGDTVLVLVYVNFEPSPTVLAAYPTHARVKLRDQKVIQHSLHIPGIRFIVFVGKTVQKLHTGPLRASAGIPTFIEWRPTGTEFHRKLIRDVTGLRSKGKLDK